MCNDMAFHQTLQEVMTKNNILDSVGIEKRFKMLLVRNSIMQNYDNFKQSLIHKDHVKSIMYSESTGSRMSIMSGSTNPMNDADDVQIEESKAYFDTKPTIMDDEKLKSIFVVWKGGHRIRYIATNSFLIIQLLYAYNDLSEGIEQNAFQKIREFEV